MIVKLLYCNTRTTQNFLLNFRHFIYHIVTMDHDQGLYDCTQMYKDFVMKNLCYLMEKFLHFVAHVKNFTAGCAI